MSIDITQTPPPSRQEGKIPAWFSSNRFKRGAALYWAVLLTMSAAIIHFVGILVQTPHSGLIVALLLISAVIQVAIVLAVVAFPVRRLLLAATVVEGVGLLFWFVAHFVGIPDGFSLWRPETLNLPDLYLPTMELVSALCFLYLFGRTWNTASRAWRLTLVVLPSLLAPGLLLWIVLHSAVALVIFVVFILDAGIPTTLQVFFLPVTVLLLAFLLLRLFLPRLRERTPRSWQTVLILLPVLLVVNITTWIGGVGAATTVWFPASSAVHAPAGQTTTLEYCRPGGGSPLAMDLSEPAAPVARPVPVVFYIHGGEALQGSRLLEDGSLDGLYFTKLRDDLVSRGFAVGSIDYGLATLYSVSDEVKDAKCAVRFLRAHANDLGIDPQRIGVYGPSQGGYISSMLATAGPQSGYDVGQYLNQSSSVQAVVDMWGPMDLSNFSGSPGWVSSLNQGLSGGHKSSAASLRARSPIGLVAHGDPPFLIIHGAEDWFIAPHHSQDMTKALHVAGVPVTLVMVQNDEHGLAVPPPGKIEQPSPDTLVQIITNFFVKTLG